MTNHLVDGGKDGLGIPVIPDVGWNGAPDIHDVLVADLVERLCAHARRHVCLNHAENLSGESSGTARHFELLDRLDGNAVGHQCFSAVNVSVLPSCPVTAPAMSSPPASSARINSWQISL